MSLTVPRGASRVHRAFEVRKDAQKLTSKSEKTGNNYQKHAQEITQLSKTTRKQTNFNRQPRWQKKKEGNTEVTNNSRNIPQTKQKFERRNKYDFMTKECEALKTKEERLAYLRDWGKTLC